MISRTFRHGSALVICMIVLVVVSALAVSVASFSEANVQIASNQRGANRAFASAESGLEVMRYWFERVRVSSLTPPSDYLSTVIARVQSDLQENGISNFRINTDGSIPTVMLDTTTGQNFRGHLATTGDPKVLRATVMGTSGVVSRTITVDFHIEPYYFRIFNYGTALKGSLELAYNPHFTAATDGWEADVYIESSNSLVAADIEKNGVFDGKIDIGNPDASVSYGSLNPECQISNLAPGEGPEFPVPYIPQFRKYATGEVIDTGIVSEDTWTNAVIAANTNPKFTADNVNIRGILYIEAPNQVTFSKITTLEGMIVAEGDVNNPGDNRINFGDPDTPNVPGNFIAGPYPPGPEFDAIRSQVGSCILAPGFEVSFWKNFSAVNGVIFASGLYFDKNATAVIKGTLIDYRAEPTVAKGNLNLTFDRSGMVKIPAGFDLYRVLIYNPISYSITF